MRDILRISLITAAIVCGSTAQTVFSQSTETISYTFKYLPRPDPSVEVTLVVGGESDGSSRFAIAPEWGGIPDCQQYVHDLTARDSDGQSCDVIVDDDEPNVWTVHHDPGADLIVTYQLRQPPTDPLSDHRTKYAPSVSDTLFHMIGETGVVYPEWLEDRGELDIEFEWQGFAEQGWTTVSSHDADHGHIRTDLQGFRHAVFLAGQFPVVDRAVPGGTLRVAISGRQWDFTPEQFADQVAEIVTIEREFFDDTSEPFFLVTLVPTGHPVNEQSLSIGGTGLVNSFALFLAPGTSLDVGSMHRRHVLHLLAHEYFHTWNGGAGTIALEEPEELTYWFSEGFTDFYASRLLRRAGLFTDQEWVDRLNETILTLWRSPVATEPATIIRDKYWTDRYVRDLPYDRGELVAVMLDQAIRESWDNKRSLDDFMRDLLADARRGEKVETEGLLERISQWTGEQTATTLREIVVNGALPTLPSHVSEPSTALIEATVYEFDAGFDTETSIADGTVSGVRDRGPAYRAGLRNGQTLKGYSIHYNQPDKEVTLTVLEHGQLREINYYPKGAALLLPRYVLD